MTAVATEFMLTTTDNPFNPFTQWEEWLAFDLILGHNTPAYLARVVRTSDELSEADQSIAIDDAMDEIVKENPLGIYKKVEANSYQS